MTARTEAALYCQSVLHNSDILKYVTRRSAAAQDAVLIRNPIVPPTGTSLRVQHRIYAFHVLPWLPKKKAHRLPIDHQRADTLSQLLWPPITRQTRLDVVQQKTPGMGDTVGLGHSMMDKPWVSGNISRSGVGCVKLNTRPVMSPRAQGSSELPRACGPAAVR